MNRLNEMKKSSKSWTEASLNEALKAVQSGMSIRSAAKAYNIPRSTLYDYVVGKVKVGDKPGPPPI